MKPAEQTPLTCLRMGELALEAGIPDGRDQHRPRLRRDRRRRRSSSTRASTRSPSPARRTTGKIIMRNAAETLKRVTLRAGRQEPQHRLRRRRPRRGRRRRACSACTSTRASAAAPAAGCSSKEKVHDEFVEKLADEGQGPQARRPVRSRRPSRARRSTRPSSTRSCATSTWARSRGPGASPAASGTASKGYFIEPTIFADVKDDMAIATDEIFGPVLPVLPVQGRRRSRSSGPTTPIYGLAAAVWTRDIDKAHAIADQRPRRHRLGQLLRRLRRRRPLRRLQDAAASAASSARRPSTTTPSSRPSPCRWAEPARRIRSR